MRQVPCAFGVPLGFEPSVFPFLFKFFGVLGCFFQKSTPSVVRVSVSTEPWAEPCVNYVGWGSAGDVSIQFTAKQARHEPRLFSGCLFSGCSFPGCLFSDCSFSGCLFYDCLFWRSSVWVFAVYPFSRKAVRRKRGTVLHPQAFSPTPRCGTYGKSYTRCPAYGTQKHRRIQFRCLRRLWCG